MGFILFLFLFENVNEKTCLLHFKQLLNIIFFSCFQLFWSFVYVQVLASVMKEISPMTKHNMCKRSFIGLLTYSVVHVHATAFNINLKSLKWHIQNNCTPSYYFSFALNKRRKKAAWISVNLNTSVIYFYEDELFLLFLLLFLS